MKIIFFSSFYKPEFMAAAFRASENASIWKSLGQDVTVFTGYPNYPLGKIFDNYDPKLLSKEYIEGIRVFRSKIIARPNTSIVKRLENALSYFFFGMVNICSHRKEIGRDYDVVLGSSGVVFNALLAQIYAAMNRIPFVLEFRDITFMQMQATGRSADQLSVRMMKNLELWLSRKAVKVVLLSPRDREVFVGNGIPSEKIAVITNGVDAEKAEGAYEKGKRFTLSYFGTLGLSQSIQNSFPYAQYMSSVIDDFEYLIIGNGARAEEVKEIAKKYPFIRILPGMSATELELYYRQTQLSVICLRNSDKFKSAIPSKLFQIMGRGIAVLFIGPDGECADMIRKHQAGIALCGDEEENIRTLTTFFSQGDYHDKLRQMGDNGRKAVEENYSRTKLAKDYLEILKAASMQCDSQ